MNTTPVTICIPLAEYAELKDDQLFLQALRNGGVDNWDWYDEAVSEYLEMKGAVE